MACNLCAAVRQFGYNVGYLGDIALNTLLLGSPRETLSARTARARAAGSKAAAGFCSFLSFFSRLFGAAPDHCTAVLKPGTGTAELWRWS